MCTYMWLVTFKACFVTAIFFPVSHVCLVVYMCPSLICNTRCSVCEGDFSLWEEKEMTCKIVLENNRNCKSAVACRKLHTCVRRLSEETS